MNYEAILHVPLSNYAYGTDEEHIVFRLRTARNDIKSCILHYGDRSCRQTLVLFSELPMQVIASDTLFDYYEVKLRTPYTRVCYYFEVSDGKESKLYYADDFHTGLTDERSEYYQFPFNRKEDIAEVPKWVNDAIVYNIFPDSFATGYRFISGCKCEKQYQGHLVSGKNGGTIGGILENLDYIQDLGANCIYLNPIFAAGEYHKYDLLDYFHVDPCFGTNEDFHLLVQTCHQRDIRVIIDGVFNHCGWNFSVFEDVVKNGEQSKYKDWFYKLQFPVIRPDNMEDYPNYSCFGYERKMPKMNTSNPEVIAYFQKVCSYWIKNFDIDGWRLDAANEINFDFWRMFRKTAKALKPDCLLIGEIWESAYPWLHGDQFDSAMNYDMRKNCRDFFALEQIDAAQFESRITNMLIRYPEQMLYAQLNVLDTHDVPRFLSLCNGNQEKFRLAVVFLFTFIGIPSVFYGDEQAIQGITEEDYRQVMSWKNTKMVEFYKNIIQIRKSNLALREGKFQTVKAKKNSRLFAFVREKNKQLIYVILNAGNREETVPTEICEKADVLFQEGVSDGKIVPYGFAIFRKK